MDTASSPPDFDQWVQIIVAVLVFGGAVFGSITKKLIEFFKAKGVPDDDEDRGPLPPKHRSRSSAGEAGPVPPPVARPVPTLLQSRPPRRNRPTSRPVTSEPPILRDPVRSRSEPPVEPQRASPPVAPPPPPARRRTSPPVRRKTHHVAPGERLRRVARTGHGHIRPLRSNVGERAEALDATVDKHLDRIDLTVEPTADALPRRLHRRPSPSGEEGTIVPQPGNMIGALSRGSLRRAIVWKEILGPPLALRPPQSGFADEEPR